MNDIYTQQAAATMKEIKDCLAALPVCTHISTITVNVKLSKTICLEDIKKHFQESNVQDFIRAVDGMTGLDFSPTNTKNFSNSLVFKFLSEDRQQKKEMDSTRPS